MSWRVLKYMEMNCLVGSCSLRTKTLTNGKAVESSEFARKKARNHSILIGVSHYNQHSHFLNTNADSRTSNPEFQKSHLWSLKIPVRFQNSAVSLVILLPLCLPLILILLTFYKESLVKFQSKPINLKQNWSKFCVAMISQ